MSAMASEITSLTIVCWNIYSGTDQRKHHSSVSLAFVREIHRWPVNSPHKWPVTRKMFPFDDVIMGECHKTLLIISKHWLEWLGAIGHQAFTWTNVDKVLWCHMASLDHNELIKIARYVFVFSIVSQRHKCITQKTVNIPLSYIT